jgi:hypothetical protein
MTPITYIIQNDKKIPINTLDAKSSTFGMVAPLEKSQTNIVQLFVTDVASITNIQLALIDTGGIVFSPEIFGVDSRNSIDTNIYPESFFTGISNKDLDSQYNITVNNLNKYSSEFIYLNMNVPIGQDFIAGTIRYQWFFDYA